MSNQYMNMTAIEPDRMQLDNLKWETTKEVDFGIDLRLTWEAAAGTILGAAVIGFLAGAMFERKGDSPAEALQDADR